MKGLLIKDLRLIRNSSSLINAAFMIIFCEMLDVMGAGELAGFGGMPVLLFIFSVNIRNYDACDNGMACLFTLPVSRRGYVRECYMFAVFIPGIAMFLYSVIGGALTVLFRSESKTLLEYLGRMWNSYKFLMLMIIFMLPLYLAVSEKKRGMVFLIAGGVMVGLLVLFVGGVGEPVAVMVQKSYKTLTAFPIMLLSLAVSYAVSVWIMERKEF